MAVPSNTVQTFAMVGIREQLSDVITNIMPLETPIFTMAKKTKSSSRTPEWQRDTDDDPAPTNATVEGDDVSNDATAQPERLKNIVQLFDKVVQVSSTASAVATAGRKDEMKYQMAKKGRGLKRDIEARAQGNYASVVGNASTAGQMAGIEAYLETNASRGSGGSDGGFDSGTGLIDAATDGTTRVITEDLFKGVIADVWTNGGESDLIICGPKMKQKISTTFTGVAAPRLNIEDGAKKVTIQGGIDLYRSDFGLHKIMPTRLGSYGTGRTRPYRPSTDGEHETANRSVLVLDTKTWTLAFLQPISQEPLAKLGHSERRMLKAELTLECSDERANGVLADVKVA